MMCCNCKNNLLPKDLKLNYDWFDVDHIEPLCKGGKHSKDNIQLLCQICHSLKSAKEQSEYQSTLYIEKVSLLDN